MRLRFLHTTQQYHSEPKASHGTSILIIDKLPFLRRLRFTEYQQSPLYLNGRLINPVI